MYLKQNLAFQNISANTLANLSPIHHIRRNLRLVIGLFCHHISLNIRQPFKHFGQIRFFRLFIYTDALSFLALSSSFMCDRQTCLKLRVKGKKIGPKTLGGGGSVIV